MVSLFIRSLVSFFSGEYAVVLCNQDEADGDKKFTNLHI